MTMVVFKADDIVFTYRTAGIALRDNQVLLQYTHNDNHWFVPGGRVEFGESSADALQREMQEEAGETVQIGPLLWITENFFSHGQETFQEIGFYYRMDFAPTSPLLQAQEPVPAHEEHAQIIFQWLPLSDLPGLKLYPSFLVEGLQHLPTQTTHVLIPNHLG